MVFARLARKKEQGGTTREMREQAGRPILSSRVVIVDLYRMTRKIRRWRRVAGLIHFEPEGVICINGVTAIVITELIFHSLIKC